MQFELPFLRMRSRPLVSREDWLLVDGRYVRLWLVMNPRARRYVLRLRPDGTARVTVPRGGSAIEARRFVQKNTGWLAKQLQHHELQSRLSRSWTIGAEVLFQGAPLLVEPGKGHETAALQADGTRLRCFGAGPDFRPELERQLWGLAKRQLPPRVLELAALHGFDVRQVSVRNQRSRWGSCSRRGTISLNWRLIQAPDFVRDYIIFHELAHLRQMNHSARFWDEVQKLCPGCKNAERWLKQNARLLR